jgi:hypothetical protein
LSGSDFKTPSQSGYGVVRPEDDEEGLFDNERQILYRSTVGSLLYIVKHSRSDISNSVQKFSKVIDRTDEGHWKELMRLVKYVSLSRNKQLSTFPNEQEAWNLKVFTDSDYCGDKDTRRSVSR